jgi:transporter family-2 protein
MYDLLSLLTGVMTAFLVAINGSLSARYGVFGAAVVIHVVGSIFAFLLVKIRRQGGLFQRGVPGWMYLGGLIGVFTVVFYNFAYGKISLTSIVALGLFGQTVTALVIDGFGLFGMRKYPLQKSTLIGAVFAAVGIYVMLDYSGGSAFYAVVLSFAGGVTIVLARTVNAGLSKRIGALRGSYVNHFVGLAVAVVFLFLMGRNDPIFTGLALSAGVWMYFGGVLGVLVVLLSNIIVPRIPAFHLTLLTFIGQIFAGIALDLITKQGYSPATFCGGLLVAGGVGVNMLVRQAGLRRERNRKKSDGL